jgi:hypothetical protein
MTPEDIKTVYDEVKRHYGTTSHPYYLSEIGTFMRDNGISKPNGVPLKDHLSEIFEDRLFVVQDPAVRARATIATPEMKDQVTSQIVGKGQAALGINDVDYRRLPFALSAAFCKSPADGKRLFFRTVQPFRYDLLSEHPNSAYVEIGQEFLLPSLWGKDANSLSEEERLEINKKIGDWARAKSINLQSLYVKQGDRNAVPMMQKNLSSENALQRLIAAQDSELRGRIRIPLDLADALMRIP